MDNVTASATRISTAPRSRGGADAAQVLSRLEALCGELKPGDIFPGHIELMARYDASERTVRWALGELQRQGKIVRRRKVGTIVAERGALPSSGFESGDSHGVGQVAGGAVNSRTVVAIAPPGESVFDRALRLLLRQAEENALSLVCRLSTAPVNNILSDERPLGYMLFGRDLLPLARQLREAGHRVVLFGTPYANTSPDVPCVSGDQEHGGYLATRYVLDLGHRHIAFRGSSDWTQMRRWRGHELAIREARRRGVEVEESAIFEDEYERWRRAPELAAAYFRGAGAPTAIVAWNDQTAMSLLSLLSYVGVRVPQDVSLVGYDNLPEGEQVHPPLTTVDIALEEQLRVALGLLTQPQTPSPSQKVLIASTLVPRESTAAVPDGSNRLDA